MTTRNFLLILVLNCAVSCWMPLQQKEPQTRLETSVPEITLASNRPDGGIVRDSLEITFNRSWSAVVSEGGEWLSLDKTEQLNLEQFSKSVRLVISAEDNKDPDAGRTGQILISTADKTCLVKVIQRKGASYLRFKDDRNSVKASPAWFGYKIEFTTNSSWKAEIRTAEGFDSISLQKSEGTKDDTYVHLDFPPAHCFGRTARAVVRFSVDGDVWQDFEISQEPSLGAVIVDTLSSKIVTEDSWPFASPLLKDIPTKKIGTSADPYFGTAKSLDLINGYKVILYSTAGLWYASSTGLNCGGGKGNYLKSPAVEGHHLTKVHYRCASTNPRKLDFSILKEDLVTVVPGGETFSLSAANPEHTWVLSGTEDNKSYCLTNANTGNFYIGDFIFFYE